MGNNSVSEHADNVEQHEKFGQVRLSESKDQFGNEIEQMQFSRTVENESEINKWSKQIYKIDDSIMREVLLLPNSYNYQSTGLCGSNGVIYLKYDHFPYIFEIEILNRRKINRYFLETELWYLFYNLVRAGAKFQKLKCKIGDVHPNNILINNDGLVKLISTCSLPRQLDNFQKLVESPKAQVFLAPEQIANNAIDQGEYPKNIDPTRAECFSMGMCMLTAGTLQNISSIYTVQNGQRKISRLKINQYLKIFGQKYSSFLYSLVSGLLAQNPLDRKRCSEIYNTLQQYEDKILDLEQFLPNISRMPTYSMSPFQNNLVFQPLHSKANSTNIYYQPKQKIVHNNFIPPHPISQMRQSNFQIKQSTYSPLRNSNSHFAERGSIRNSGQWR